MTMDEQAFREELVSLLPRLRRFAVALASGRDAAEDLLQSAVERALRKRHTFEAGKRLDSWMFKIMQNLWKDRVRKVKSDKRKQELDFAATDQIVDGRKITETSLMLTKAREQFSRLSEEQRTVLALVVIDGHSYQEAADQLEIPIGTLMSRLYRAREALRMLIEQDKVPELVSEKK